MRVRLRDLAESLGISVMAVSKALRDEPDIGAKTKERVRAEAEKRGYWPNEAARSLRVKQSGLLGLILPDLASEEGALVAGGLCQAAEEAGLAVLVGLARNGKQEADQVRAMMGRGTEAIFFLPRISTEHRSLAMEAAQRAGHPMIFFKRYPADVGLGSGRLSWVVRDMKGAAEDVLDHLFDLGHRSVAYLGGHPAARSYAEHLRGVQEGMEKRGMTILGGWSMVGLEAEGGEKEMKKILAKKERPTAVICGNDAVAVGATRALLAAGVQLPTEMSVTGVGNGELARHGPVPLTSVGFAGLGKAGFTLWQRARQAGGEMKPVRVRGDLVIRASTGKI